MGPDLSKLVDALPGVPIIDRSTVNAFDDPEVAERSLRPAAVIDLRGDLPRICAAFPAMTAVGRGLSAYVAVDASGYFQRD